MVKNFDVSTEGSYHPLMSWRSIVAGLVVALLVLAGLSGLGMAFGGIGLDEESSLQGALKFTGIWAIATLLISIAAGAYFSARFSGFSNPRVGAAQGTVIAALLLGLVMWQALSVLGWAGRTAGDTVSAVGGAAAAIGKGTSSLAQNGVVQDMVEDAVGDLKIQQDRVQTVVTGVATRLYRGDVESAKLYLSRQTGVSPAEAQQRIDQLKVKADQAMVAVREGAATTLRSTGWTLFIASLVGALAGAIAGGFGSRSNRRQPLIGAASSRLAGAAI